MATTPTKATKKKPDHKPTLIDHPAKDHSVKSANPEPLIIMEGVTKSFPMGGEQYPALHEVNLTIDPGDFALLIGPSGSGKSTILNLMIGLELPTAGKIWFAGQRLDKMEEDERASLRTKKFGFVHQQSIWIKSLSILENVAIPLIIAGMPLKSAYDHAHHSLAQVGMGRYSKHKPTEISGGQQQRISLARALVNNPKVIVLDEPTGNLDTHTADEVMQLLQKLNHQHKRTIVMVTHNLIYLPYANRTISVLDGRIEKIKEGRELTHAIS